MCDTLIALGSATQDGTIVFGKNSDREPDEVQNLLVEPAKSHPTNAKVKCTYIEIPQASQTNRVLLSKPFWMFGAEMGANEHGVVIGNEALFTKIEPGKSGLTGMDLLRLALERTSSAVDAREKIIELLELHGQGGKCGYRHELNYMNGFIIADRKEAFILETVEKEWAWKQVEEIASISNCISLEQDFDESSSNLIEKAIEKGWADSKDGFNFQTAYSDKLITWGAAGKERQKYAYELLELNKGNITPQVMASILRTHGFHENPRDFRIHKGFKGTVCKHAANNLTRPDSTTNSFIAHLHPSHDLYFTTGSSNPCLSPYFPLSLDCELPETYIPGGESYDATQFWWQAELVHRRALRNYWEVRGIIQPDLVQYEHAIFELLQNQLNKNMPLSQEQVDSYFSKVQGLVEKWSRETEAVSKKEGGWFFKRFWKKYNKLNQIPE